MLNGYKKIQQAAQQGMRPLYRRKNWMRKERVSAKMKKEKGWLGKYWKSKIFVPYTPGSKLKQRLQLMEAQMRPGGRENHPIKIIETSGKTLEVLLKPPAAKQMCLARKCMARDTGTPKIGCRVNGVGYKLDCRHCLLDGRRSTYIGESGKNGHCRILEHQSKFRSKKLDVKEESAFYKHMALAHSDIYKTGDELEVHFNFEVLKVFKFPLDREVDEGVRMVMHTGVLLNSKTEWFSPSIVRTTIEKGGAEMAHQPAKGYRISRSQPSGRSEESTQSSKSGSQPQVQPAFSQPVELSSRDQRMRNRELRQGSH